MANNKVTIDVALKTSLEEHNKIKSAGGFQGKSGERQSQKILSYISQLEKVDFSKLSGPELTKFINDMKHMRKLLDSAARSLSSYSKEVINQQKEVEKAEKRIGKAQEKQSLAVKKRQLAAEHIILSDKNTFFNKKTGKQVSNIDTIADLFSSGQLDVRGKTGKKSVSESKFNEIVKQTGIQSYAEAKQEVANAKIEVSNAKIDLTSAEKNLKVLQDNSPSTTHPLTTQISGSSMDITALLNKYQDSDTENAERKNATTISSINSSLKEVDKQTTTIGKAFKQFTLYNVALKGMKSALREALSTVKELDKELTEQAMVTGLTRQQTYGLIKSYQELALQTGATTKEIAGVATEYIKQGKSISDAMALTEAAVSAAKVARVSTADSVNYLTTALNGFQLAASDAMRVSDKFAAVAAASATDYDELAIALSKVASQANLAGMSIDYTTALLTKGLETTREAPETMGTALKTIIARMRELSDYGETLEGDTDINNVESQLAYIGIALRNTEGELRSTEDVLDDLGQKWDTLNKNQQAAVAKALAGTRQQSRLIALMTDYERVIELQEIAQRSAGATAAQAGVYLEGMEASMNKVTVAWEKIVTSMTNSEVVINTIDRFANVLEGIGGFLSTDFGLIATLTVAGSLIATSLGNKIREVELSKIQQKYTLEENKLENQINLTKQKSIVLEKKLENDKIQNLMIDKEGLITKIKANIQQAKDAGNTKEVIQLKRSLKKEQRSLAKLQNDASKIAYNQEASKLTLLEGQNTLLQQQEGLMSSMVTGATGLILPLKAVAGLYTKIAKGINAVILKKRAEKAQTDKNIASEKIETGFKAAKNATQTPIVGWVIAAGIMAAAGIALGSAMLALKSSFGKTKTEKDAESVNKLSNEIYKLQEKANALDQLGNNFDKLDNKIIKTKKDMEEMNSILDQVTDKLSEETTTTKRRLFGGTKEVEADFGYGLGVSEKEYYEGLVGDRARREAIDLIERNNRITAKQKRDEQIALFRNNSELLNENTQNAEIKKAQTSIYANAVYNVQEAIDELKKTDKEFTSEVAAATEEVAQALVEAASLQDAFNYADNITSVTSMIEKIKDLKVSVTDIDGSMSTINASKILTSDDYGLTAKVNAFAKIKDSLAGSATELALLNETYSQYKVFENMGEDILKTLEYLEITIEDINKLSSAWEDLVAKGIDISQEEYNKLITEQILPLLAETGGDIKSIIDSVFGGYLSSVENYEEAYTAIVNSFANIMAKGQLNLGQNVTKLKNTVNGFYEKASKWADLSDSERAEFMSENADLFKGEEGASLLNALETNNWQQMQAILQRNEGMQKRVADQLKEIEIELATEEGRIGKDRNEAYIKQLRAWKAQLENQTDLFRADLEFLIDQEQKQLDIYKDFLQKQQEQLEESLDKRKEAYEKYFEAINAQQETEDYQEKSNDLISKISQLSSSTDASSKKQAAELVQQLEELEIERQKDLRERAQQAVLDNLDNEVKKISEKFDELINNEKLLLEALGVNMQDSAFLTQLLASGRVSGMTDLQLEQFARDLQSAFGSSIDVSNLKEVVEQIVNNATINIGNQTLDVSAEEGSVLWQTLLSILTKYGIGK